MCMPIKRSAVNLVQFLPETHFHEFWEGNDVVVADDDSVHSFVCINMGHKVLAVIWQRIRSDAEVPNVHGVQFVSNSLTA